MGMVFSWMQGAVNSKPAKFVLLQTVTPAWAPSLAVDQVYRMLAKQQRLVLWSFLLLTAPLVLVKAVWESNS
eukprot:gene11502-11645_t